MQQAKHSCDTEGSIERGACELFGRRVFAQFVKMQGSLDSSHGDAKVAHETREVIECRRILRPFDIVFHVLHSLSNGHALTKDVVGFVIE